MINKLPDWALTSKYPAFYDSESGSAIEMVGKVYAAMQNLIEAYNQFETDVNANNTKFENSILKDMEEFKTCVSDLVENYINMIDLRLDSIAGLELSYNEQNEEIAL